jgi:hypothetical protein
LCAAVADNDLDRAIDLGLLTAAPCPGCSPACTAMVMTSRDTRRAALAARERYRTRQQRLERRARLRGATGTTPASPGAAPATAAPALPAAAAAALARARARAQRKPT